MPASASAQDARGGEDDLGQRGEVEPAVEPQQRPAARLELGPADGAGRPAAAGIGEAEHGAGMRPLATAAAIGGKARSSAAASAGAQPGERSSVASVMAPEPIAGRPRQASRCRSRDRLAPRDA
ncbi:MAG: hypothetical protein U1E53_33015 [Dongiaceae bacterium]